MLLYKNILEYKINSFTTPFLRNIQIRLRFGSGFQKQFKIRILFGSQPDIRSGSAPCPALIETHTLLFQKNKNHLKYFLSYDEKVF